MSQLTEYRVTDFDCPTCASTVERSLEQTDGVERVAVHYTTGRVEIEYDDSVVGSDSFEQTIANQGYTARLR